ncbi:hypothetical protein KM914_21025 [Virgibacillus pantothenticus]|uniref:hypothetical protein n=1 Tax=Virgibacillus pantothenticus TaxID=1473 RepID=UPI001C24C76D|nr:hypothetical protein [Virgibacillus pantothenticus]MBU8568852.1 hypothetical protein [Virgibacillus pantothenticus]MBU8601910.1 hypothetical protein [Virgibacillus pantothenticus]MBU8635997.1 hypothetical protein [Virgibacillus pantothenticus]MBU8644769.1 hypothetical protein [Virgibacillus pantothenticus]MBU8647973.1 hypothetical protein [Virgibacillus pantothenticus]
MEIKISIDQAFTNAVLSLAQALSTSSISKATGEQVQQEPAVQQPVQQAPAQQEQPAVPVQQQPRGVPVAQQQEAQVQQQAPVQQSQGAVPTSEQTYTMDHLARAASQLMDAGKQAELVQLLGQFGVQALTALPQEQYGTFATKLREMGAKI